MAFNVWSLAAPLLNTITGAIKESKGEKFDWAKHIASSALSIAKHGPMKAGAESTPDSKATPAAPKSGAPSVPKVQSAPNIVQGAPKQQLKVADTAAFPNPSGRYPQGDRRIAAHLGGDIGGTYDPRNRAHRAHRKAMKIGRQRPVKSSVGPQNIGGNLGTNREADEVNKYWKGYKVPYNKDDSGYFGIS